MAFFLAPLFAGLFGGGAAAAAGGAAAGGTALGAGLSTAAAGGGAAGMGLTGTGALGSSLAAGTKGMMLSAPKAAGGLLNGGAYAPALEAAKAKPFDQDVEAGKIAKRLQGDAEHGRMADQMGMQMAQSGMSTPGYQDMSQPRQVDDGMGQLGALIAMNKNMNGGNRRHTQRNEEKRGKRQMPGAGK